MEKLIEEITKETSLASPVTGIKSISDRTLLAIKSIDRALFVTPTNLPFAYEDRPLPIGHGQTISQPFIVALITELLDVQDTDKVLEVGSGSGYQLAILAKLAKHAFGIELIPELFEQSKINIAKAGINNVTIICGDGTAGSKEYAPFDKIVASAAAQKIPKELLEQLKPGGILVIPQGSSLSGQVLLRIKKTGANSYDFSDIIPVRFVPLINS
jgi:protein-L-isoaspartate(D-aspartate) O-methyltransferase